MMFILIGGKKVLFSQKRVKRMHEALLLISRGIEAGKIRNVQFVESEPEENATSLNVTNLQEIVQKALRP